MRRPLPFFIAAIILLAVLFVPVAANADAPSMTARFFYGTLKINGQPAPAGTIVEARGNNVKPGSQNPLTTTQSGYYGVAGGTGSKLGVQSDPASSIVNGTQIDFYINGILGGPGYTWQATDSPVMELDLSVTIQISSSTQLTSSANPSIVGQPVTFTATVSGTTPYVSSPSGSFSFFDSSSLLANVAISAGQAVYTTSVLSAGSHVIKAVYSGDNFYLTSQYSINQSVSPSSGGGGYYVSPTPSTPSTAAPSATPSVTKSPPVTSSSGLDLAPYIDSAGLFKAAFKGQSPDGRAVIYIPAGTVAKTSAGEPLTYISILPIDSPSGSASTFKIGRAHV
jgi:hypothetical protein